MKDLQDLSATMTVQLFKITSNKDGGGRIQLDFGADSLEEIHKIQKANGKGGMCFQLALVPLAGVQIGGEVMDFEPDPVTGEIPLASGS